VKGVTLVKENITFDEIKQNLDVFSKIYDNIRFTDPYKKKILYLEEGDLKESEHICYAFWESKKICSNCVIMRALQTNEIIFKLEYSNQRVYLVMALPVISGDTAVAVELIKDVTNSIIVDKVDTSKKDKLLDALNSLNQLQVRDGLTGLFNRRFIEERLPAGLINSTTTGNPISIIMLDIDYFKKVNDTYGHLGGDFALKELSSLLSMGIRDINGWVARYGGEEFLICLMNTSLKEAQDFAEQLRKNIEGFYIRYNDQVIKITASFGVATAKDSSSLTVEAFIDCADKNLYRAKNAGRNKVIASSI
jgi:two-component system, cell cycle response regulator